MGRLSTRVEKNRETGRKSLVAYLVAGDAGYGETVDLMHTMVGSGVDVIELGVPFTDPEAEGPVIQLAHERAIARNTALTDVLTMVRDFRRRDGDTPVVLMGYLNPVEQMGYKVFAKAAAEAGVDGTIIVNLPPEEAGELGIRLEEHGIDTVYLLAPTTTTERAAFVTGRSRGFVYYVSLKGTTGASNLDVADVEEKLSRFREAMPDRAVALPIMVGFGIKDAATASAVARVSDGVVVGSAIVSLMAEHAGKPDLLADRMSELIAAIRGGLDHVQN